MSESGKFHYQNLDRRRDKPVFRLTPQGGRGDLPAGCIVHFLSPSLTALCNQPSAGLRLKTKVPEKVTCPACLKKMKSLEVAHV